MADKSKIYSEWDDIIDESTLLRFAKQADIEATERLIQHYARMVRAIARTYYLSGAESEDAIQEGMLGLLYAIRSYDPSQKIEFSAYARVCIERRLISAWRKANSHKHDPLNYAISLDKSPFEEDIETDRISDANPESMLIHQEEQRESHERLRELLSFFEAQVLSLYLDGLSYEEIADYLHKPVKSIDNAIQRVRRKAAKLFH
jgi:RNA polymerase sporulation-specific sigma factor